VAFFTAYQAYLPYVRKSDGVWWTLLVNTAASRDCPKSFSGTAPQRIFNEADTDGVIWYPYKEFLFTL